MKLDLDRIEHDCINPQRYVPATEEWQNGFFTYAGVMEDIPALINRVREMEEAIEMLILSSEKMLEAYIPSYDNKWQAEDAYGISHRKDWRQDSKVRNDLASALAKLAEMKKK